MESSSTSLGGFNGVPAMYGLTSGIAVELEMSMRSLHWNGVGHVEFQEPNTHLVKDKIMGEYR